MLNEIQILNNGYPMPSVGLGVYKISDEDMTKVVNAEIDALNRNARQGKNPDDVKIGDLK